MKRYDIINHYVNKLGAKKYLEIGLQNGISFDKVIAPYKVSVDPDMEARNPTYRMTSDEFFENNKEKFEVVFIDGLHTGEQVYKDIVNSLRCLEQGGVIICHDMSPTSEIMQRVPRVAKEWTGDCWKAFVQLKSEREDLSMFTVDTDYGVGVIESGKNQEKLDLKGLELTYENLDLNRKEWLNLIAVEEFLKR